MSRLLLLALLLMALGGCTTLHTAYQRLTADEAVPSWDCGDPPGTASPNDVGQSGGNADSGEQ
jgi:hypothetical protein